MSGLTGKLVIHLLEEAKFSHLSQAKCQLILIMKVISGCLRHVVKVFGLWLRSPCFSVTCHIDVATGKHR